MSHHNTMDPELRQKLEEQDKKIQEMLDAIRGMKRRSRWALIINILVIVLPLIALLFILPSFLSSLGGLYSF